jgi:hypothetical protein
MTCAECGHGIWHRIGRGKRRTYVCGNVRHATGACDAKPFDAELVERAVLDHLRDIFIDFDAWLEGVTEHRSHQRADLEEALDAIGSERRKLDRREQRVRRDYRRATSDTASRVLIEEVEQVEREREQLDAEELAVKEALDGTSREAAADALLDFWNELSAAIRERVCESGSVRDANEALRERFAAIFVRSPEGGPPRLDFVLREREPGAPLVSTMLWAVDPDNPDHEGIIEGWQHPSAEAGSPSPLTLV